MLEDIINARLKSLDEEFGSTIRELMTTMQPGETKEMAPEVIITRTMAGDFIITDHRIDCTGETTYDLDYFKKMVDYVTDKINLHKDTTEPEIRDSQQAFENAIKQGMKEPELWMYMYTQDNFDFFKHIDTRQYISFEVKDTTEGGRE